MNYSGELCFPSRGKLLYPSSEPADKQACALLSYSHPKLYENNCCHSSTSLLASISMFAEAAAPRRAAQGLVLSKRGDFWPVKQSFPNCPLDGPFSPHCPGSLHGLASLPSNKAGSAGQPTTKPCMRYSPTLIPAAALLPSCVSSFKNTSSADQQISLGMDVSLLEGTGATRSQV